MYEESVLKEYKSQAEIIAEASFNFKKQIDNLRNTINLGDVVKITRNDDVIKGKVCEIHDDVVLIKTLKDCPCDMCDNSGSACENACKNIYESEKLFTICREYWRWYGKQNRYSATYVELLESGNR